MLKKYTPPAGNSKSSVRGLPPCPPSYQDPTTTSIIAKVITIQNQVQRKAVKVKEPSFQQSCRKVEDFMECVMPKRPPRQRRSHSQVLLDDVSIPLIAVPSIMRYTNPYEKVEVSKQKSKARPKAKVKVPPEQCQLPFPIQNTSTSKIATIQRDLNRRKQRGQCRFQQRTQKNGMAQRLLSYQEANNPDMPRGLPPEKFYDEDTSPYGAYNNSRPCVRLIDHPENDDEEYSFSEEDDIEKILENMKQNFEDEVKTHQTKPSKGVKVVKFTTPQPASPEPTMSVLYMCPKKTLERHSKANICMPSRKLAALKSNSDGQKLLSLCPKKTLELESSKTTICVAVSKPEGPEAMYDERVLSLCPKKTLNADSTKKNVTLPISKFAVPKPNCDGKVLPFCSMKTPDLKDSKTVMCLPVGELDTPQAKYHKNVPSLSPKKALNIDSAKTSMCPSGNDYEKTLPLCLKKTDVDSFEKAMCVPISESEHDEQPCSSQSLHPKPIKAAMRSSKKLDIGIWKISAAAKQRDHDLGLATSETFTPEITGQETEVLVYEIPRNYEKAFAAEVVFGNSVVVPRPPRKSISHYSRPKEVACLYVAFAEGYRLNPDFWTAETMEDIFEHATKLIQKSVQMCYKSTDTAYDILTQLPDLKTSVNVKLQFGGPLDGEENICSLLTHFFSMHSAAMICSDNLFLLAWKRGNNSFFIFDPNGRNELCQRDLTNGKCTLMATGLVEHMVHLILNLSHVEPGTDFNMYDLSLSGFGKLVRTKTPQMSSSSSSSSSTASSASDTSSSSSSET